MITDFFKHHCSQELKDFLEVDSNTKKSVAQAADMVDDSSSQEKSPSAAPTRRGSVKSMRRKQNSTNTGFNYDDETPAVPQIAYTADSKPAASSTTTKAAAAPRSEAPAPPPPSGPKPAAPAAAAPPAAAPAAAAPQEDEVYRKYRKMLDMLPEGAVIHKMTADGFSQAEIDRFLGKGGGGGAAAPPAAKPAAAAPAPAAKPAAAAPAPAAKAPAAAVSDGPPAGTSLPPKATGGRANLLASISALRKD